jgi:NhaP-type Na+/H+ or K+/H+ antiporter|tara:strand:- start:64 stop:882 length:819 start_codon:yes stop_codon:yes gene_type:complete
MTLLTLGGLFLIGLIADIVGRFTPLPRITVLLISGLLIGPSGFALISDAFISDWFEPLTNVALTMIGFLMGQKLSIKALKKNGKLTVVIALVKVLGTALVAALLMWLVTGNIALSLILGGIATATDPAATYDVVHESAISNSFTNNLLSIFAIDDALGLIVFSLLLTLAITGTSLVPEALLSSTVHIIASLLVGAALAVPMSYLTGRLDFGQREGEPIQAEAIGFVLVCAGATIFLNSHPSWLRWRWAVWSQVSLLITIDRFMALRVSNGPL